MRYYSYRPPRITREIPQQPNVVNIPRSYSKYLLIFGLLFTGAGLYFSAVYHPPLISAVIDPNEASVSWIADAKAADLKTDSKLEHVVPFLKTAPIDWKVQQGPFPIQAVGGGPGLLKDALDVKAGFSVNFETGEVYYAANANSRMGMASTTKLMTSIVAMDLASMDEQFTVEPAATQVEPTVIGVQVGEKLTTRELIKGGLLTSGNDAMAVLAEGIGKKYGGDTSLFVQAMNEKAKFLGLKNTHFTNPQGYDDPNHYTTCEELATIAHYALTHYPELARIVTEKEEFLPATATHKSVNLPNWNMLINTYPGADGVKIGNTGDAGHTTVASATRNGKRVLVVVLGASGILKRDMAASELLNVGFSRLGISPFNMTEDLLRTRIKDWY